MACQLWRIVHATVPEQATLVLAAMRTLMNAYWTCAPMALVQTTTVALRALAFRDIYTLGLPVTKTLTSVQMNHVRMELLVMMELVLTAASVLWDSLEPLVN